MSSLYNNYNNLYNNRKINMSFNKLHNKNNIFLLITLLIMVAIIYILVKHFNISFNLIVFYNWILGVEKNMLHSIEEEEEVINSNEYSVNQVFNISQNKFTFSDAKLLCKSFGTELATLNQVLDAYKHGANWCNMGWTQDQLATYPIQQGYWEKLQESGSDRCGFPGVNGGYYKNPNLKFGVNCYGKKPGPKNNERIKLGYINNYSEDETKIVKFKHNINRFKVLPFNDGKWSEFQ